MSKKKRKLIKAEILEAFENNIGQPFQVVLAGFSDLALDVNEEDLETGGKYDLYALAAEVADENEMISVELKVPNHTILGMKINPILYLPKETAVTVF